MHIPGRPPSLPPGFRLIPRRFWLALGAASLVACGAVNAQPSVAPSAAQPAAQPAVQPADSAATPRAWQTPAVRQQAQAFLQRWRSGALAALDDAALLATFRDLPPEVLATAVEAGTRQHEGFEIWMQRQERIDGSWNERPFLNHIKFRQQPRQVYMAWLPGGPKAGQEILYDARRRPDALYGHLGGAFNVMSIWTPLDGRLARQNSNHTVLDLSPRFVADVVSSEWQRYRSEGRSPRADHIEVTQVAGQRTVALTWSPGAGPPAHYAARTRICLNLRQPWVLQAEAWDAAGEIQERILFEKVVPTVFTDADFDPEHPSYRF